ncbi:MAG: ABC transporter substrate-binding protein [Chloroflexi bacterium]|nr:ABC transporter substrate-binding protein [Chloroflexota bacterium]
MRIPRMLIAPILGTFMVTACGAPASSPSADPTAPSERASAAPTASTGTEGGTLVVAISSDPGHLNPAITTSGGTHTASELLYNGLVGLDDALNPVPELAESWEISDDGRTYTFTLRDDVVWHDGEAFTSEDVKFSFEEVLLQFHARTRASMSSSLESIEAPDETTVVFNFAEPYGPLLLQLDVTEAPIVAKHIYEGTDPVEAPANLEPVGTGPFKFVSYTPESEIRFAANDDYFRGRPAIDEVVQRIFPDSGSAVIALETGDVHWLWGVPGPDQERLQADDSIEFLRTNRNPGGANCIMTVGFNLENPILADVDVRTAIAHALDRQAFLERVLFNEGRVAEAPISSGIGWAHAEGLSLPAFDTNASATLLDGAGWIAGSDGTRTAQGVEGVEDGTPLAINFLHFPTFSRYGELLRTQLGEVGIDVELVPLEPPVFAETVFTDRDFDTNIVSYCNGTDPEIGVRRMYDSAQIGPVPFSNAAAYSNPDVDALFTQAVQTIDLEERGELYRQIQEIVAEDLPYFWLVETEATRAYRSNCSGFIAYAQFAEAASCATE